MTTLEKIRDVIDRADETRAEANHLAILRDRYNDVIVSVESISNELALGRNCNDSTGIVDELVSFVLNRPDGSGQLVAFTREAFAQMVKVANVSVVLV